MAIGLNDVMTITSDIIKYNRYGMLSPEGAVQFLFEILDAVGENHYATAKDIITAAVALVILTNTKWNFTSAYKDLLRFVPKEFLFDVYDKLAMLFYGGGEK